jgi:hypothetical protein
VIYLPVRYFDLSPQELHIHVRHFLSNGLSVEIGINNFVVPCKVMTFKRKSAEVYLGFRVSTFGRPVLLELYKKFSDKDFNLKVRRSTKKKLVSQFFVVLQIQESLPLEIMAIFRDICSQANIHWPPKFAIGYPSEDIDPELPGRLEVDNAFWKLGRLTGKFVRKIFA